MIVEPLLPVGRDCDCGHPLVWSHNHQICAVYGSHTPDQTEHNPHDYLIVKRNDDAPLAWLVDLFDTLPLPDAMKDRRTR